MTQQGKNAIDLVLAESLIELSAKKPIDKITIKEITDKAGVIRPTFYNHFQDKYELIEWIIKTELLEPIKPLLNAGMIFEAIVLMLNNISANSVFTKSTKAGGRCDVQSDCHEVRLRDVYEYHKRKEHRKEIQIPLAHTGGDFYILCAVVVLYHRGLDSPGHG